jgi:ABC-type sugar transport system, periplasmic component
MPWIPAHRFLAILLFLAIFVTGCKKSLSEPVHDENETGNFYEEKEIPLQPQFELISLKKANGGQYVCFYQNTQDQSYHFAYTDPELTQFTPIPIDSSKLVHLAERHQLEDSSETYTFGLFPVFDVDSNGGIHLLQYDVPEDETVPFSSGRRMIFVYRPDGQLEKRIPIDESQQMPGMMPVKLVELNDRYILISYLGVQIVNEKGATIDELPVPSGRAVDPVNGRELTLPSGRIIDADVMKDKGIVLIQEKAEGNFLSVYDITTKKTLWSKPFHDNFLPQTVQYEPDQQEIYVASDQEVIAYSEDGEQVRQVIDFNRYSAGSHTSMVFNGVQRLTPGYLLFEPPDRMVVYLFSSPLDRQVKKIYAYRTLSGDEKAERLAAMEKEEANKTHITLYVPYVESTLKQKIAQFERLHPDIRVHLTYYREHIEEFNPEDYMQYVNLQLLSGQTHWDIMAIQMLPYREYVEKGYFADVERIDGWAEEKERYFSNILDAARVNGKLAYLPARIFTNVNLADEEAARELSPFTYQWSDLLRLTNEAKAAHPDRKPWSFGTIGFRAGYVLSQLLQTFQIDLTAAQGDPEKRKQWIGQLLDILKAISVPEDHVQTLDDKPLFTLMPFFPSEFQFFMDSIGSDKRLLPMPASPWSKKHAFTIPEGYAINDNSKAKEAALQLIMFLVDHAEPYNIALKKTFEEMNERLGTSEQRQEAIRQLQAVVEHLDWVYDIDPRLSEAISHTAEQYVNGITDKETAIRTIEGKLWLHENE